MAIMCFASAPVVHIRGNPVRRPSKWVLKWKTHHDDDHDNAQLQHDYSTVSPPKNMSTQTMALHDTKSAHIERGQWRLDRFIKLS
jgi:hypothetical protein